MLLTFFNMLLHVLNTLKWFYKFLFRINY